MKTALAGKDPGAFQLPGEAPSPIARKVDTPDTAPVDEEAH
jgi:hypothetical protein